MVPHGTILVCSILALCTTAGAQITRGYLGIVPRDLSPQQLVALKVTQGVEIAKVDTTGPAAQAGLKEQDVIVTFDGKTVTDSGQIQSLVRKSAGRVVQIGLIRGDKRITVPVEVVTGSVSIETEANEQAHLFGGHAFAKCPGTENLYCIGPFDENPLLCSDVFAHPPRRAKTCEMVVQIHATAPDPFDFDGTTELSSAERAEGVQWKGSIRFTGDKARSRHKADGEWLPWGNWQAEQDPNQRASVMVGAIWKKNGEWLASDLRATGLLIFNDHSIPTSLMDLMKRASNQGGMEQLHFAAPRPMSLLLATIKQPSCEEILTGKRPVQPSPVQSLGDRTFSGTVDEFAAALPGYVEKAAYAMRTEPKNYAKEMDFVIAAVRTCSEIDSQMFSSLIGRGRGIDFSLLGTKYGICGRRMIPVSERVGHNPAAGDRGIELEFEGVGGYGQEGRGFHAIVRFSHLQGDSFRNVSFDNYGIVAATIPTASRH
jgi:hypothetical protein